MTLLKGILLTSLLACAMALPVMAASPEGMPNPGLTFSGITNMGNTRTLENMNLDTVQHPVMMVVEFGGLAPKKTLVELLPTGSYWSEYIGNRLTVGNPNNRGRFIQVADPSDKPTWDRLAQSRDFLNAQYGEHIELAPLNFDSLIEPGTADMVFVSKKMAPLMRSGNFDKVMTAAFKALKPGGTLLVEDYRADKNKPQDPKAVSDYIREDYAVAQIQKSGFKFVAANDELLANPSDGRVQAANSDRFILKFTK